MPESQHLPQCTHTPAPISSDAAAWEGSRWWARKEDRGPDPDLGSGFFRYVGYIYHFIGEKAEELVFACSDLKIHSLG